MGSDKLFNRRKARQAKELARHKGKREPYDKVLIVCEGKKTEPNYFNGLKDHFELNSANIEVTGDCGSSPISIVEYAKQRYREENDSGDAFDKVYCVFDKDTHTSYQKALDAAAAAKPKGVFTATTSVPCFEFWLLLHFTYTTAPYRATGRKSAGDVIMDKLLEYFPGYKKGDDTIFEQLVGELPRAMANAERSLVEANANHTDNPSTTVHELIGYLQKIKSST